MCEVEFRCRASARPHNGWPFERPQSYPHLPLRRATDNESRQVASRRSSFWAANIVFFNAKIGQARGECCIVTASAAAAAPEVFPVDAVASAVAECSAALAASKKALTDVLSAELSLKQLRKECRTAEQHRFTTL